MKLAMKGLLKVINEPENYHNLKEIFFLSGLSCTHIHESQDCKGRGKSFP